MASLAVEARALVKKFPDTVALKAIDLTVPYGAITALIGPDGAGKTTFIRLMCGLMTPTEGTLKVLGEDITKDTESVQNRLSYMPQKFGLYEDLTVAENMNLYADLHGVPQDIRPERFKKLLEMTGLARFTGRLAGKLSGGMKQKLGLACTLVRQPDLLILDEPTVGVDPMSRKELWEILNTVVKEQHLTIFVSTAYMNEAEMCSNVYVLNKGVILAHGSPSDISNIAKDHCFNIKSPADIPQRIVQSCLLDDREHIIDSVPRNGFIHYITTDAKTESPWLSKWDLTPEKTEPQLEDGFMILLRRAQEKENDLPAAAPLDLEHMVRPTGDVNITVRDLVKKFGNFTAVSHTSFEVHKGEVFGLLGPNGAGKTTTFRMLCGLLPATSGELSVAGYDLRTARTIARKNIGYVSQKFALYKNLSVMENLKFYGGIYGLKKDKLRERIQSVMKEFQLEGLDDREAGSLPGGYKQRLSMAAALLQEPQILFLDEPTSGIDPLARRTFWRQITGLAARGTTIIITTHFMEEAEYCDRIMIQDNGKMLVIGSPEDIRKKLNIPGASMDDVFIDIVEQARKSGKENEK